MATLVLTAVGSLVGGPVGGMIGALAGQAIDARIFKPAGRSGPRLNDLQVQTSRYGTQIPRIYGRIRVAGTVIWATDLKESSATSGGGKGRPSVTSYSYSASFAVALSARRIMGIGRIWADGNLLRGAAGDFKAPVGAFRLHAGEADQAVDPLIAADVGPAYAPAFRDCAYAVFDGLQLADFGNRIPSLTFEVIADAGPLGVAAIASDLAGEPIGYAGDAPAPTLSGFAADGADLRDAVGPLTEIHGLLWRDGGGALTLAGGQETGRGIGAAAAIRAVDGRAVAAESRQRLPIEAVPVRLALRYHDPERDFQAGIQTAERPGPGTRQESIDLPAALSAGAARGLADAGLRRALRERLLVRRALGWAALDLRIGDVVTLVDEPGRWRIEASDWDDMAVKLTLRAQGGGTRAAASAGDPGAALREADLVQGPTRLAIVELPPDGVTLATAPTVFVAATGADAGWRRAVLLRYHAGLDGAEPIGRTAPRAVLGTTLEALPDGAPWRIDRRGAVEVVLDNGADALTGAGDEALLAGANLCLIGEEVLQFGVAEPLGTGRFRLSRLIRGWHGTEWACASHQAGERFVLLDAGRLAPIALTPGDIGQVLDVRAIGSGDPIPAEAARRLDGRGALPLAPVHGRIAVQVNGDLAIRWVRRSRFGWAWPDLGDAPLGEEQEVYLLRVMAGDAALRSWEAIDPFSTYPVAHVAADEVAAAGAPLRIEIVQRGTSGVSRPLILPLAS
ncbi:MAG: hypothetical protein BGP16_02885 [Sphingobium sp. 66-54]|nr:MAG: hypothetical protein BGP16_02885 [Sphingobium sp. 66-54]